MSAIECIDGRKRSVGVAATVCALLFVTAFVLPAAGAENGMLDTLRRTGRAFAKIAQEASPAVVGIQAEVEQSVPEYNRRSGPSFRFDPFEDDLFDFFFRRQMPRQPESQRRPQPKPATHMGSGFIISPDGYILTNNHLVGKADKVTVKLLDGREFQAEIVGADKYSDVAVIKIDAPNLTSLELADSEKLEVGEWVLAIGNPFGLSHTVTAGIVSAKGRSGFGLASYEDFIQTDAAINRGNSGGPLLNLDGRVVGMNTAILGPGTNIGIGLAIPINMAKAVYQQLVKSGKVVRGFLGVEIQDMDPELAESFGRKENHGVLIPGVTEGSAADKAGIRQGDIVVEFEGKAVRKANELRNRVAMHQPGSKVEIVVLRDGQRKRLTVVLDKRPSDEELARKFSQTQVVEELGLAVQELTDELAERLGYEGMAGVVVTEVEPGSIAAMAGISEGTLILEVNRRPVSNPQEFNNAVKEARKAGKVLFLINKGGYNQFLVLTLPQK